MEETTVTELVSSIITVVLIPQWKFHIIMSNISTIYLFDIILHIYDLKTSFEITIPNAKDQLICASLSHTHGGQ